MDNKIIKEKNRKSKFWTKEEIELLKNLAPKYKISKIAKVIGRTQKAIISKSKRMNIQLKGDFVKWTKQDEDKLREFWGSASIEIIAAKMNRTTGAIKSKAYKMKLGPMHDYALDVLSLRNLEKLLKVNRDKIVNKWQSLGLNLQKRNVTNKTWYYYVTHEDLLIFLKNNPSEWDSRNLEINILGIEQEWLIEKRKEDSTKSKQEYKPWTTMQLKRAKTMILVGYSIEEVAINLDKKKGSVAKRLRELGLAGKSSFYWQDDEIEFLKENYKSIPIEEISKFLKRSPKSIMNMASRLRIKKRVLSKKQIIE